MIYVVFWSFTPGRDSGADWVAKESGMTQQV